MRKNYRQWLFAALIISAVMVFGCAKEYKGPSGAVLRFIDAVRSGDSVVIDKSLSYERLMVEKEGEAFLNMSTGQASRHASEFRDKLLKSIVSGPLNKIGSMNARVKSETVKGDRAEVVVYDDKNRNEVYGFLLALEGGSWKIYKITHL